MSPLEQLKELGLSEGQVSVYSACLELGIASLNQLHEKTGIERRNIYDILNKLIEKGLISYIEEKGRKTYQCTHPNKIKEEIQTKQEALAKLMHELPNITARYNESKPHIKAEVYRGDDALKALLNEALEYKESFWIGGNSGIENAAGLKFWFKHWMERRAEQKHIMHDLVDYGTSLEDFSPHDIKKHKKFYYKYCQLPKDLSSPMVILIFGNKVAQILWSKQSFAFVLESPEIKESFMKYFNYFWKDPW
jgi:HTH-type transcriptional regulator, sugar sensing transcriptional regulator